MTNSLFSYFIRRLFLMVPTLFGILLINFLIVQITPGGPIEQMIAKVRGTAVEATGRISGNEGQGNEYGSLNSVSSVESKYRGAQGLDPEFIKNLEKMYGFDQPAFTRFIKMVKNYLTLDFGESYFRDISVVHLIAEKLPVSISLGLWSTLLVYLISIPLGIKKAVKEGSVFDIWTSSIIIFGYAIPSFLFAIMLIIFLAGGSFWQFFPLRGLVSDGWESFSWFGKIKDYFWHITLPTLATTIGHFASLTLLTKNSFLEEINKQYVITARAKGLTESRILYRHIFRNAMLIIISSFPSTFIHIFFTSSLLIEVIFSLDGLGLLGFESAINRDYPVVFGSLFIFTLLGLIVHIIGDIFYMIIDPRIHFDKQEG